MKNVVIKVLKKALKEKKVNWSDEQIEKLIEIPPSIEMGDFSFPCFSLSPILHDEPSEIAIEIREKIGTEPIMEFEDIRTEGPYINFYLNRKSFARQVVWDVITQKKKYGQSSLGKGKHTMVEFSSPNTNKPLHLGHLRNIALGESLSRILEFTGEKVTRANLNNDRGIHIAKSMLAYQKWGREKTPFDKKKKMKPDHFVGEYYTLFNKNKNKKLEAEAQELLQRWEAGDKQTLLLWKVMNTWVLQGFDETYKKFGIKHDVNFFESKIYKKGKETILEGVKKGLFEQTKEGEVKINLEKEKLGEKILLRKDGTSLYIVQDLALAKMKFDDYKIDKSLYVVANEQDYHFDVLFTILKKLGFGKKEIKHISYGMVNLPSGRMKSREGTVVDADDIIQQVQDLAEKELKKREKPAKKDIDQRSLTIALAAIKYLLLKIDIKKNMLFNPKTSVSFDGDTGPYILYSYARAGSILKKTTEPKHFEVHDLEEKEAELVKKISQFPEAVSSAAKSLNPSLIANYSYQLAQEFNEFYHACKVVGSEQEAFRMALVQSFRLTLKNALWLLGIDTIEKM